MRRRPDDRPTGLPRAYSRQAVLIAAFHDVVVATRCRTRLLDLALPVTHLTSGRAVHERLPQLLQRYRAALLPRKAALISIRDYASQAQFRKALWRLAERHAREGDQELMGSPV